MAADDEACSVLGSWEIHDSSIAERVEWSPALRGDAREVGRGTYSLRTLPARLGSALHDLKFLDLCW